MADDKQPYRYLNDNGTWPRFSWNGLALGADGALRLMALPGFEGVLPPQLEHLPSVQPPSGVVIDDDGTVYFTDPANGLVYRIDGCFGQIEPAPCMAGKGSAPMHFAEPAALLIGTHRHALYVADAGNQRVQIFALGTLALVEIVSGFEQPVSLALDEEGSLYVVDTGKKRVDQITNSGDRVPAFWDTVQGSGRITDPCAVACEGELVYVLDRQTHNVCVFTHDGLVGEAKTAIDQATVFAVIDGALYVGDPTRRRIAVMRKDQSGTFQHVGDAANYEGPVAALASDKKGGLLVCPGGGTAPLRLRLDVSYRQEGWLWSEAIAFDTLEHYWNRLHASVELPVGSHVQFFVHTGPRAAPPAAPSTDGTFALPWRAVGDDITNFFLSFDGTAKHQALWLGARFTNDFHATAALSQARVDFDQPSYLPTLPAIYREATQGGNFLLRYVSLFESFFDEAEARIDDLPALVNPAAAPSDALAWLAGFLALPLPEVQGDDKRRESIAGAYARYARRGTVDGLREALRVEAGVRALIDEPLQAMGWWAMPSPSTSCKSVEVGTWTDGGDSILGFNTVLASAEPQGAVVGTTATLDGSQLISQDEFGTTLFEGTAYRFLVRLYPGELQCAGKLEQVRAIVEREKPAHTLYDLCIIDSGMRVGYQACLGIDTLLGGRAEPGRLGETALVLGGQPRARMGVGSLVGTGAQL